MNGFGLQSGSGLPDYFLRVNELFCRDSRFGRRIAGVSLVLLARGCAGGRSPLGTAALLLLQGRASFSLGSAGQGTLARPGKASEVVLFQELRVLEDLVVARIVRMLSQDVCSLLQILSHSLGPLLERNRFL